MLTAIRGRFPPPTVFHIDCNGGYDLEDDYEFLSTLDQYELAMIEQPLCPTTGETFHMQFPVHLCADIVSLLTVYSLSLSSTVICIRNVTGGNAADLLEHAKLASIIKTPICLDESLNSLKAAQTAINLNSGKVFNIKPGRCGGATVALQIMALAKENGIPCWIGGMLESAVGAQFCKALAALDNCSYPADIFPSNKFYQQDLSAPDILVWTRTRADGSKVTVTSSTDTPHTTQPIPSMLNKCTVARFEVWADGGGSTGVGLMGGALRTSTIEEAAILMGQPKL